MTQNRYFAASLPTPTDGKENKMYRRKLGLIVGTVVLAAAVTVAVRVAALSRVSPEPAAVEPLVNKDLNDLKVYRASEWGLTAVQPAPVDLNDLKLYRASEWGHAAAEPASVDLNDLKLYRASEWGHPEDTLTPERLYHHLMIVK